MLASRGFGQYANWPNDGAIAAAEPIHRGIACDLIQPTTHGIGMTDTREPTHNADANILPNIIDRGMIVEVKADYTADATFFTLKQSRGGIRAGPCCMKGGGGFHWDLRRIPPGWAYHAAHRRMSFKATRSLIDDWARRTATTRRRTKS